MRPKNQIVRKVADHEELINVAAQEILEAARSKRNQGECFTLVLSGGLTPKDLYTSLAQDPLRSQIAWEGVHFFWGDERHVPPDHQESNYRTANEILLAPLAIPREHIHRIKGELPQASEAAAQYEREIVERFALQPGRKPRFDVILLGMGADGHTASLFPGHAGTVYETGKLVMAPWVEKLGAHRVTLTPPVFNEAAMVMILVSGKEKATTIQHVLEGAYEPDRFPVQMIRPTHGKLLWIIDQTAASCLANDQLPGSIDQGTRFCSSDP